MITLPAIYPIANPTAYKLHLACWNGEEEPLDVFVRNRLDWDGWNAWRDNKDDFSREHILALIKFYPQEDRWLFGGAYRVLSRKPINKSASYTIRLLPESEPFIGRLKLTLKRPGRVKAVNLENHYQNLVVSEVLAEPYTGEGFAGYESVDLHFPMIENLMLRQRLDWKTALEHTKGVYMITDASNGKRYIGSAYGGTGIWSRWQCYVITCHGYNDELTRLISTLGRDHARKNFRFTLLEYFPMKASDEVVIGREGYWKNVLLSRDSKFGYNKN
jgi:hypothetical protein